MTDSAKDIFIITFIAIIGWVLSFIWLGAVGNAIMWLWSHSKKVPYKSKTQETLIHLISFLLGFIPFVPSAAVQGFIIHRLKKS